MAEAIPAGQQECRLVKERGLYWLVAPHPAQCDIETPSGDGVVALDPGDFATYHDVLFRNRLRQDWSTAATLSRVQRLCQLAG